MSGATKTTVIMLTAAGLGAAAMPPTAHTQPAARQGLEEVVVTARRREESLQTLPLAITALSSDELQARGVDTVENLNSQAPNLFVMGSTGNNANGSATFRVRGLPGVAVYIDGVEQSSATGLFTLGMVEVDRVEVLRGPQGTLFGGSALGGAISYVTRPPGDEFGARFRTSLGSRDRQDIQGSVDVPLSDTFKMKLTGGSYYRDGYHESVYIDRAYGDVNDDLLRADFLWQPNDAVTVRYIAEDSDISRNGPARIMGEMGELLVYTVAGEEYSSYPQRQIYANVGIDYSPETQVAGYPGGSLGKYETRSAWAEPGQVIDTTRHTVNLTWDINDTFTFRSITGYREVTRYTEPEIDISADVTINDRDTGVWEQSLVQELQFLGSHERFNWVVGLYFEEDDNRSRSNQRIFSEFTCDLWANPDIANRGITTAQQASCLNLRAQAVGLTGNFADATMTRAEIVAARGALGAASTAAGPYNGIRLGNFSGFVATTSDRLDLQESESRAVFADVTWLLTDQLTLAGGLRYSEDESDGVITVGRGAARQNLVSYNGFALSGLTPNYFDVQGTLPAKTNPSSYDQLTSRLTLQYQWNDDLMTYATLSNGYAPGGFSNVATLLPNYLVLDANGVAVAGYARDIYNAGLNDIPLSTTRPEQTIDNLEFGMRADWLDGALRTNVTAFFTVWKGAQTGSYAATRYWDTDGDGFADGTLDTNGDGENDAYFFPNRYTVAVDESELKGIEIEAVWQATDDLRFSLNLGLLDSEYTKLGQAGEGADPALLPGSPFPGAPDVTAALGVVYNMDLANGGSLVPRLDYTATGDYVLQDSTTNQRVQDGIGLVNARLSYYAPAANWSVHLVGTNLTDEYYYNSGLCSQSTQNCFLGLGVPREYSLQFDFSFE